MNFFSETNKFDFFQNVKTYMANFETIFLAVLRLPPN